MPIEEHQEQASKEPTVDAEPESTETEPEGESAPEIKAGPELTPVEYVFPEGMELADEDKAEIVGVLNKHKITQEGLAELTEVTKKQMEKAVKQTQDASIEAWTKQTKAWEEASSKDEEFGGAKFEENLKGPIKTALDKYGTQKMREDFDALGIGNYPELLRFLYRVGKDSQESKFVTGSPAGDGKTAAEKLYPSMPKK